MEEIHIRAHGKFLITAEYLVLKGAKGLALPLKRGQTLSISENNSNLVSWKSYENDTCWFEATFETGDFSVKDTTDASVSDTLKKIFTVLREQNPAFFTGNGYQAEIKADFNLKWGLGSSSTLISSLCTYAGTDPYALLEKTFGGSGYDIACATASGPITYTLLPERKTEEIDFHPAFSKNIFFVYLGKKMNSRTGMGHFKEKGKYLDHDMAYISSITDAIISCGQLKAFEDLLRQHEERMSAILHMPTVQAELFPDYPHTVKSMGAWGGDFVLATGNNLAEVKAYFEGKGLDTIIPYAELVL